MEFFQSKDKPEQLWRLNPEYTEGNDGPRWTVFVLATEYIFLLEQNRFDEIPDYGIRGTIQISGESKVLTEFEPNPAFSEVAIASCPLLRE